MIKFLGTILLAILALLCFIYFDELVLDGGFLDRSIGTNSRVIRSLIYALANTEIGYYLVRSMPLILGVLFSYDAYKYINKKR